MESLGWKWCVIATVHSDAAVEVVVQANDAQVAESHEGPLAALTTAMGALANFDEGDSVMVLVHGAAVPMNTWSGTSAYAALYWLATALCKACCAVSPHAYPDARQLANEAARALGRQRQQN